MRVLLADKLVDQTRVRLASSGCEVIAEPGLSGDGLAERLRSFQPHVLVVRSTRVEEQHLAASAALSLIVRAGAGVNTIDVSSASRRGVYVANCPGKNAVAVAELTLGLMLALDRHIPDATIALRQGRWDKKRFSAARGLRGRVLGIIGLGRIGAEVARLAGSLGMTVVAWSRRLDEQGAAELGVIRARTPEEVASQVDVLSVHLALTPATHGLVGESVFRAMRHGALFINTSRAEVVDAGALLSALDHKGIRAGLDVFTQEPKTKTGTIEDPLARHPSVVGTHHIGASTEQAQEAVGAAVFGIIEHYRRTGQVENCVNLAGHPSEYRTLVVRHLDRVGVLASVLHHLRDGHINVEEMENLIFAGREAAVARIQFVGALTEDLRAQIEATEHVLSAVVV